MQDVWSKNPSNSSSNWLRIVTCSSQVCAGTNEEFSVQFDHFLVLCRENKHFSESKSVELGCTAEMANLDHDGGLGTMFSLVLVSRVW